MREMSDKEKAEIANSFCEALAERAIASGSQSARRQMAQLTREWIVRSKALPAGFEHWLTFVIDELLRTDRIPHRHKGRPVDHDRRLLQTLVVARVVAYLRAAHPSIRDLELDEEAAELLAGIRGFCMSASNVKKIRARDEFAFWVNQVTVSASADELVNEIKAVTQGYE